MELKHAKTVYGHGKKLCGPGNKDVEKHGSLTKETPCAWCGGTYNPFYGMPTWGIICKVCKTQFSTGFGCSDACNEKLKTSYAHYLSCENCSGSGKVPNKVTCTTCNGNKTVSTPKICTQCNGKGTISNRKNCSHGYWNSHYRCNSHGNGVSQYH